MSNASSEVSTRIDRAMCADAPRAGTAEATIAILTGWAPTVNHHALDISSWSPGQARVTPDGHLVVANIAQARRIWAKSSVEKTAYTISVREAYGRKESIDYLRGKTLSNENVHQFKAGTVGGTGFSPLFSDHYRGTQSLASLPFGCESI
jgi:hypothetical protein